MWNKTKIQYNLLFGAKTNLVFRDVTLHESHNLQGFLSTKQSELLIIESLKSLIKQNHQILTGRYFCSVSICWI